MNKARWDGGDSRSPIGNERHTLRDARKIHMLRRDEEFDESNVPILLLAKEVRERSTSSGSMSDMQSTKWEEDRLVNRRRPVVFSYRRVRM